MGDSEQVLSEMEAFFNNRSKNMHQNMFEKFLIEKPVDEEICKRIQCDKCDKSFLNQKGGAY